MGKEKTEVAQGIMRLPRQCYPGPYPSTAHISLPTLMLGVPSSGFYISFCASFSQATDQHCLLLRTSEPLNHFCVVENHLKELEVHMYLPVTHHLQIDCQVPWINSNLRVCKTFSY